MIKYGHAGVTLVELIVAVGMICVLMMLLLPASSYSRKAAEQAKCISNLRQLGAASHLYSAERGGLIVFAAQRVEGSNETFSLIYWYTALNAYLNKSSSTLGPVFRCPTAVNKHDLKLSQGTTYSVTAGGPCPHQGTTASAYAPQRYLSELPELRKIAFAGDGCWLNNRLQATMYHTAQRPEVLHGAKANIVFFDGHIEQLNDNETQNPLIWRLVNR